MAVITNRKTSQAQKGQDVIFTFNGADAITYLSTLTIGQLCTLDSNSKKGYISEIDTQGISFKIKPVNQSLDFASTPQYFVAAQTVTI
ncbi:MAG: hypothetical protein IPJ81_06840 [Chitinophagaceae bacterium]|jgi:hypothetical protein|nr:hypothetical protein [Chitinophagaceae bacterium]